MVKIFAYSQKIDTPENFILLSFNRKVDGVISIEEGSALCQSPIDYIFRNIL